MACLPHVCSLCQGPARPCWSNAGWLASRFLWQRVGGWWQKLFVYVLLGCGTSLHESANCPALLLVFRVGCQIVSGSSSCSASNICRRRCVSMCFQCQASALSAQVHRGALSSTVVPPRRMSETPPFCYRVRVLPENTLRNWSCLHLLVDPQLDDFGYGQEK